MIKNAIFIWLKSEAKSAKMTPDSIKVNSMTRFNATQEEVREAGGCVCCLHRHIRHAGWPHRALFWSVSTELHCCSAVCVCVSRSPFMVTSATSALCSLNVWSFWKRARAECTACCHALAWMSVSMWCYIYLGIAEDRPRVIILPEKAHIMAIPLAKHAAVVMAFPKCACWTAWRSHSGESWGMTDCT